MFLFGVVFLMLGCVEKETPIDDEKLMLIMTDMLIVDEVLIKYPGSEQDRYKKFLKNEILAIHNISETALDSVMIELQSDLKRYMTFQDKLTKHLETLEETNK